MEIDFWFCWNKKKVAAPVLYEKLKEQNRIKNILDSLKCSCDLFLFEHKEKEQLEVTANPFFHQRVEKVPRGYLSHRYVS